MWHEGVIELQPPNQTNDMKGKRRSIADTFLILAWVMAYAAVLAVFRFTRVLENLRAGKSQG